MNLKNVVWTAVVAAAAVVGVIVAGILGSMEWIIASGFIGVIAAGLSGRER